MGANPRGATPAAIGGVLHRAARRLGAGIRIWALTALLALASAAILGSGLAWAAAPVETLMPAVILVAVLYFCAERFPVHLVIQRETHTFSLNELPLVIGLHFLSPLAIVLAQSLGAGLALVMHRRQPPMKFAFNLANFALGTTCASAAFHLVVGSAAALGPMGWLASFVAAFLADQLSGLGVDLVIWLSQGERPAFDHLVGVGTLYTIIDTSLALVAVIVLATHPEASWLLAILAITILLGFQLYQNERVKRESLGALQESTRLIQEALDPAGVTRLLLGQVLGMFNSRVAELITLPGGARPDGTARLVVDGGSATFVAESSAADRDLASAVTAGMGALRITSATTGSVPARWLEARGFTDAMVAPLAEGDAVRGLLIAADRMGNVDTFSDEHLALLSTLANHAAVAMKNSYLVEQLRSEAQVNVYQARHDALTDLPNRRLLRERLDSALAGHSACAVLLLDLDRFKEVNDTLGHHNGDRVLEDLAGRLLVAVDNSAMVSRLGGDEFAILLVGDGSDRVDVEERAVEIARRVATALGSPFHLEGLAIVVSGSIGIACSPDHGLTADGLLRHADVAMYNAKHDQVGFEVYRPDRDEYSASRLALVADLRTALDEHRLEVAYQMQVDAKTGAVDGAEALVRWRHPVRGTIPPDDFIGLAEHAGLIRALTDQVLDIALNDAVAWRRRWPNLRVAVNISPRTLVDPSLPPFVRSMLAAHGLPPSALTLEVTESAIMEKVRRVEAALRDFESLGCTISIDDFGTGYSSFSYLRRLPIHEIKVDRSFVMGMAKDPKDRAIVDLTIDLGHRLGTRVVAEGVETEADAAHLVGAGCDILQGYLVSRPCSSDAFMDAVLARESAARAA